MRRATLLLRRRHRGGDAITLPLLFPHTNHIIITTTSSSRSIHPPLPVPARFVSSLPFPNPEWIGPFLDVSDLTPTSRDDLHPSPWLRRVLHLLLESKDSPSPAAVEARLDDLCRTFLIRLTPAFVSQALRSPDLLPHPGVALRFFRWAGKQRGFPGHKLQSYVSLVHILSSSSPNSMETDIPKHNCVRELVSELKGASFPMTQSASASLIRSLGAMGMIEELLWVWRLMKDSAVEPSLLSYNCLLDGLVNSAFVESAEKVFDLMESGKAAGARPDVVTYNTMIKGYCKVGRTQAAVQKFTDMAGKSDVLPDKITYMTLIQAHYSDMEFDACFRLYQEMEEKGLEIPVHAYTLICGGLCKDGKPFEALAVFENMSSRGCRGNVAIFTALIDAFAKSRNEEQAMKLFERMKAEGLEPDEVTYSVIVNCLCKSGKLDKAMEWFEFCQQSSMAVNPVFYSNLIDGFGKAGKVAEAEKLFEEMVEKGYMPDAYCYNALMDAFSKSGKIDEALSLFKRMENEGCDQNVYTYTILIDGLFKRHKNEEALRLWYKMIDKGITPTPVSFRTLSAGLCLSGKVDRACRILDDMAPMGVIPETAHQDMISVLCKAGRIAQACKLADQIVDKGREIPGKVRTIFINALRKAGNADLAIKMLHSKIGIGYDRMGSIKRRVKFQTLLSS